MAIELNHICIYIIQLPIQSSIFAFRAQQYLLSVGNITLLKIEWINQSKKP